MWSRSCSLRTKPSSMSSSLTRPVRSFRLKQSPPSSAASKRSLRVTPNSFHRQAPLSSRPTTTRTKSRRAMTQRTTPLTPSMKRSRCLKPSKRSCLDRVSEPFHGTTAQRMNASSPSPINTRSSTGGGWSRLPLQAWNLRSNTTS